MNDPAYLQHLGEFASLKSAIASWFHMDAYLDHQTNEEIWNDMRASMPQQEIQLLTSQLEALLLRTDAEIIATWNQQAFAFNFIYPADARARKFLESMLSDLKKGCA